MREDILKKSEESNLEYAGRLYTNKVLYNLSNKEIHKVYAEQTGDNRGESTIRCEATNYIKGFNVGFEKALSDRNGEAITELEEKQKELEKATIIFQDQKREYRNYLRADARFEHLKDEMSKAIKGLEKDKPMKPYIKKEYSGDNVIVAICSDWHIGLVEENHWNKVNNDIMKERISKYADEIIEISKRHNASILQLELLGDLINGLIHVTTRISNEEDVIAQTMTCSEILAEMIQKLSQHFKKINVYSATGNHGRCVANGKDSIDTENFERLVPWYLQTRLRDIDGVEFKENEYDSNIIVYKFLNETIFAVHGHEDKVGSAVNELTKMLKIFPSEIHAGHFHSYFEKDDHDISLLINGTASGVDKFAKKIRKTSKPVQVCAVYTPNGRQCTYKVRL